MKLPRKRILIRAVLALAMLCGVVGGLDELSVEIGVPARPRFSTFTINRFYRVNEKFNKFSLDPMPSVEERCVNALLPHFGSRPCWYVQRHTIEMIAVN